MMIMMKVMAMVMIKCSCLEKKKEKNKIAQGKVIFDRSVLFWHSRHLGGVTVFMIDSHTTRRGETHHEIRLSKCH